MDNAKFVPLLVGLLIAVVLVGAVFIPVVQSSTTRTVTTEIENEGAEWLKLGYNQGTDYSFTVGFDGEDNFTVGTQTGEYENLICYADNERTLFVSGDNWYLLTNGETPSVHKFTENASVTNASGTLTILDGSETVYTGASPTWAYVPDANGVYGFFTDGGLNLEVGKPKVAVGSYAGAFAYNETVYTIDGHSLNTSMIGDYSSGDVVWGRSTETALEPLNPSLINPTDLDLGNTVGLMDANPSGSTTIEDLCYTFNGTNAKLVGYDSAIDWSVPVTIPEKVTYDGTEYTVNQIGSRCFFSCTNLLMDSIPDSITNIEGNSFRNCSKITVNTFSENVTNIGAYSFNNCTSMTNLIFAGSPTVGDSAFAGIVFDEVLNLGDNEITTTSYGFTANEVRNIIPAIGYIAPTSITQTEVVPIDSPVAGIMQLLPLIAGIGALFLAVGTMIYTRF